VAPKILERGLGIDSNTAWAPAFKNNHDPAHFPPTPPLIFLPRWWQHSYPLELENRLIGRSELPASVALIAEQCLRRFSLVCASICCKSSPRNCKICDPPVNRHTEPRKSNNEPLDRKPPGAPPTGDRGDLCCLSLGHYVDIFARYLFFAQECSTGGASPSRGHLHWPPAKQHDPSGRAVLDLVSQIPTTT
jgi:hypothetical protein